MKTDEISVALWFKGDGLDPSELTELIGVAPNKSGAKGAVRQRSHSGGEIVYRTGIWMLRSTGQSLTVSAKIENLLSVLQRRGYSRNIVDGIEHCFVSIYFGASIADTDDFSKEISLTPSLIMQLAEFGIGLEVTFEAWPA